MDRYLLFTNIIILKILFSLVPLSYFIILWYIKIIEVFNRSPRGRGRREDQKYLIINPKILD